MFSKICRRETAEQHRLVIFLYLFFLPSGGLSHLELGGNDGKHNLIVAVTPRVRIRHGYVYTLHDVLSKLDILVPEIRYFSTRAGGLLYQQRALQLLERRLRH